MWIALLVGLGVGVLAFGAWTLWNARRYRVLFSDTHLIALAGAAASARQSGSASTGMVTVRWENLASGASALVLEARLAPAATRFFMAFLSRLCEPSEPRFLQLSPRSCAIVSTGPIAPIATLNLASLPSLRAAAADQMRLLPLTPGSLGAWR